MQTRKCRRRRPLLRRDAMIAQGVKEKPAPPPKEVRTAVRDLLTASPAFARLPQATQLQIAKDTAEIAGYLARPEGIPAETLPTPAPLTALQPHAPALDIYPADPQT